jgi:hypothetical protein
MIFRKAYTGSPQEHIKNVGNIQASCSFASSAQIRVGHESLFAEIASSTDAVSKTVKQVHTFTSQGADSPVSVRDGKIGMKIDRMEMGKFYPVDYRGKKYLISKTKEGVIDIFKVVK